jgi:hypothetical protein
MVEGVIQRADAKNQNGRVYPKTILEREVENLIAANTASIEQRDRLRNRIVEIETSAEYLRAQRIGRFFQMFKRSNPTT